MQRGAERCLAATLAIVPLASACHAKLTLDLPFDLSGHAIVIAFEHESDLSLVAAEQNAQGGPIEPEEVVTRALAYGGDSSVTVLSYHRSLAELGLTAGLIAPAAQGEPSANLPAFDSAFVVALHSGEAGTWSQTTTVSAGITKFRVPLRTAEGCANEGGCYEGPTASACTLSCPEPPELNVIETPAPPSLRSDMVCPDGWTSSPNVDDPALPSCVPPPRMVPCDRDELQSAGGSECTLIGAPCSGEGWPSDLPPNRSIVYVDPASALGGTGDRAHPFARIRDALPRIGPHGIIALHQGTFSEHVHLTSAITIWGACVHDTILTSTGADPVILATSEGAEVHNLRITGARIGVRVGPSTSSITLDAIAFDHLLVSSVEVSGAGVASISSSSFRGWSDHAIFVANGGNLSLESVAFEGGLGAIDLTGDGTRVVLDDVAFDDTEATTSTQTALISIAFGSQLRASAMAIAVRSGAALDVSSRAFAQVTRSFVERTDPTDIAPLVDVHDTATASLGTSTLERGWIRASGDGTRLVATAIVIAHAPSAALLLRGGGGIVELDISDLIVRNSSAGIDLEDAKAELTRAHIHDVAASAVLLSGASNASISELLAERSTTASGIDLTDTASISLHDVVARSCARAGIAAHLGASLRGTNVRVSQNAFAGIIVEHASTAHIGSLELDGNGSSVSSGSGGVGLVAEDNAHFEAMNFAIANNASDGLIATDAAQIELAIGKVSGQPIGASLRGTGVAAAKLLDRVRFANSVRNIETE